MTWEDNGKKGTPCTLEFLCQLKIPSKPTPVLLVSLQVGHFLLTVAHLCSPLPQRNSITMCHKWHFGQ